MVLRGERHRGEGASSGVDTLRRDLRRGVAADHEML